MGFGKGVMVGDGVAEGKRARLSGTLRSLYLLDSRVSCCCDWFCRKGQAGEAESLSDSWEECVW